MAITLLLADDHKIVREGLRMILEAENEFRVVAEANDGWDAISQATELRPDVTIMDISMPLVNGIEATRELTEQGISTRVVILSMHSSSEHVCRAFEAGAMGYVLKDSAGKEVAQAARVVHSGKRYLSDRISDTVLESFLRQRKGTPGMSPLDSLSSRERMVLQLVAEGKSSAEIAEILFLSPKTVETYRSRSMKKLGIENLAGLIRFALTNGLTTED